MITTAQNGARVLVFAALLTGSFGTAAFSESLSNRHHLSGCTQQSAPVVIPHADARTVRLGLPADVGVSVDIEEVYGWDEETRLSLRRQGLSVNTQGGRATLSVRQRDPC